MDTKVVVGVEKMNVEYYDKTEKKPISRIIRSILFPELGN
jgi:hypothetical protein